MATGERRREVVNGAQVLCVANGPRRKGACRLGALSSMRIALIVRSGGFPFQSIP